MPKSQQNSKTTFTTMKRSIILIVIICLSVVGTSSAQTSKLKRAHKAFADLNYQEAIELYTQILAQNEDATAMMNLAESYRKVGNTLDAEYWLSHVVHLPESESLHKLHYGQMLQTNGKCDLAKEWFLKYVEEQPEDLRGQYLFKACDHEEELMTKSAEVYEIENMPFNTEMDDFSPALLEKGLVYSSEYQKSAVMVQRTSTWTGNPFLELYYVNRKKKRVKQKGKDRPKEKEYTYEYGESSKFSGELNSKYHDAAVSFSADGSEIYFTRNNLFKGNTGRDDNGDIRLKVFYAQMGKGGGSWSRMEGLPFNSDEYSVAHPAISPDGKFLYFASDMPGGFGGMDIYVTEEDNGRWMPPLNLGPGINTEGHEVFPYVSHNQELYFASNGHLGLGGLDIYTTKIMGNGSFGPVQNLGYPINSKADDFAITMEEDGKFGYFSSDRDGGQGGDDIYSFSKSSTQVRLLVFDERSGSVLEGATVTDECNGLAYTTDATGTVTLEMKKGVCCNLRVQKADYDGEAAEVCTKGLEEGQGVALEIPLFRPLELQVEGFVLDQSDKLPIPGAKITLMPECDNTEAQTLSTAADGSYRFTLTEGCCYKLLAEGGQAYEPRSSTSLCTKGLNDNKVFQEDMRLVAIPVQVVASHQGTSKPSSSMPSGISHESSSYPAPVDGGTIVANHSSTNAQQGGMTLESFSEGRTPGTYLLNIYYDFDQSYLRDDAFPELDRIYQLLQDNPQYVVEVGSHTDSRGSNNYNYRLSQRRAEAVVRYLRDKGVDARRMVAKGYGETVNVNNCSNNIPCSEEEHQWNRRTEFRILQGSDPSSVMDSEKPKAVTVDACLGCPF